MLLLPRNNNYDLWDDFFDDDFFQEKPEQRLMKTDIKETKDGYELDTDLPGFEKENINLSLNGGYLTIQAKATNEEKNEKKKYLRRERYYRNMSRSFYVGDNIKEEDINASFKNGILSISIPKKELTCQNEVKQIAIK